MVLGPVNLTLCEIEVKFKKYFTKSIRSQDGLIQQKNGVIFRSFTYPRMIERNTKCKSNALQVKMRREDVTAEWTMCSCTMLIERITCVR